MKKYIFTTMIILITLTFILSGTALAESPEIEVFEEDIIEDHPPSGDSEPVDMYDIDEVGMPEIPVEQAIYMQWEKEGYPDDIGGFFYNSESDTFGVLVVNPSQRRIGELLEMFENKVFIVPCSFSFNELMQVQNEITEIMVSHPDSGIFGSGIGWTSKDRAVHGFGESGKEFRVTVTVDESVFEHYYTGLNSRYGDRVHVEAGLQASVEDLDGGMMPGGNSLYGGISFVPVEISGIFVGSVGGGNNASSGNNMYLWIATGAIMLCALLVLVRFRLHQVPTKQTVNGNIITTSAALTTGQIIDAVKNSGTEPGKDVFPAIMKKIENV